MLVSSVNINATVAQTENALKQDSVSVNRVITVLTAHRCVVDQVPVSLTNVYATAVASEIIARRRVTTTERVRPTVTVQGAVTVSLRGGVISVQSSRVRAVQKSALETESVSPQLRPATVMLAGPQGRVSQCFYLLSKLTICMQA